MSGRTWLIETRPEGEGYEITRGGRFQSRCATERAARHYVRTHKDPADKVYLVEDDGYRVKLASL